MSNRDEVFSELTQGLDLTRFWAENTICQPPAWGGARSPLEIPLDDHWLLGFWGIRDTSRYFFDKSYRDDLHKRTNAITCREIGLALFDEDSWQITPRRIENLFGCEFSYRDDSTPWLTPVTEDPSEFTRILDKAEETNVSEWAFPAEFLREWDQRLKNGKPLPLLGGGSRGPATIMTSILRPETFFLWCVDHPELIARFRDILARQMVNLNLTLRRFSGNKQPGWSITDDNSALFNRRLYREYCFPVLHQVMEVLAPTGSHRYQHSDSAMAHLLELQRDLGITGCNYGPTVTPAIIRSVMPEVEIHGQVPPGLLRDGTPQEIRARVRKDWEEAGDGFRLVITTAGSVSAGTSLERIRWLMRCVEEVTRP